MERRQNNQGGQPNGSSRDQSQQWTSNQRASTNNDNQNGSQQGQSGQSGQSDNTSGSQQGQTNQQSQQGQQSQTNTGQQGQQTSGTSQQGSNNQQNSGGSNGQSPSFGQQGSNNGFGGTPTVGSAPTQTLILLVQTQSSTGGSQGGTLGGVIATASPLPTGGQSDGLGGNDQSGQRGGQSSQGGDGSRGGNDSNGNDSNRGNNGSNNDNHGNNGNNGNGGNHGNHGNDQNDQNDGNGRGNGDDNTNNHNQQYNHNGNGRQDGGGISDGTVKGIAIGASVGGVLILAIIFYIFWRRRKGASLSQIARFRSPTNSKILSPSAGNDNMTTLPIYRNDRFSVRSSRHDSLTNVANPAAGRPTAAPRSPLSGPEAWKSSNPPKVGSPEALQALSEANRQPSPSLSHPQQAHLSAQERSSATMMNLPVMKESNVENPGLGLLARHSTDLSGASDNEWPLKGEGDSAEDIQNPDRWSWSNSNAPPTPRIVPPNARASLQSYPGGASLAAWLRNQREDLPLEAAGAGNKPLLKNQAAQPPTLSPEMPPRKDSRKNHGMKGSNGHSLAGMFKPNNNKNQQQSGLETWTPPKGADSPRPSTNINVSPTVEITEKI
ncbi:hypothetical protein AC579_10280 [Pseudocercospora musae]|uniref:Uncharacterized protein n=1 Tax=Pseudocercospora musae TaxID=113226 RepID=A0A139ICH5_9PEZI|nr:hypothetical protein AC579_10280 [Pseudocercospora musae]